MIQSEQLQVWGHVRSEKQKVRWDYAVLQHDLTHLYKKAASLRGYKVARWQMYDAARYGTYIMRFRL